MDEQMRRRMLWIAIVLSSGYFLVTLLLAASGGLSDGWYLVGAGVYGGLFLVAVAGFLTERVQPVEERVVVVPAAPAPAAPARGDDVVLRERVMYTTPTGEVLEATRRGPAGTRRTYAVVHGGYEMRQDEVERRVDARRFPPAPEGPREAELVAALGRWGHVRNGGS